MSFYNKKYWHVWFLLLMLSGCGFHLRSIINMPAWLDRVAIIYQPTHRNLALMLKNQLEVNGIRVCAEPARTNYWLVIEKESFKQHVSSISSSTTPRQYQLVYLVNFKLQKAKGKEIIPLGKVIISRQITINSNRILGSSDEELLTKNEMRRDAVFQILNQISKK